MRHSDLKVKKRDGSVISIDALSKMTLAELKALEPTMRGARIEEFYDTLLVEPDAVNGILVQGDKHQLFRKGMSEIDTYFGQETIASGQYTKQPLVHTNMRKNGEFEQGSAFIVCAIECPFVATANVKSGGVTDGMITQPAVTSAGTNYDPVVLAEAWLEQTVLRFKRNQQIKHEGLLSEFPSSRVISGAYGGSIGGFVQNATMTGEVKELAESEVIIGGEDFSVEVEYCATALDTSVVNQWIRQRVVLRGLYIYEIY